MRTNFKVQRTPQFSVLSPDQIEEIHLATLEVLERTGVEVFDREALELLRKAGALISDGNRVRIPPHLVEEAIRTAPKRVTLANRNGERTLFLEDHKIYFGTGSDCPNILDSFTGERRRFTKEDVAKAALICDYLPNIDFVMSLGLVSDVPTSVSDRHQFEAMLLNTEKPIVFTAHDSAGMTDILKMCEIVAGGKQELRTNPFVALYAEPTTPLRHTQNAVQKLLLAAERSIPVVYTPCPMAGATAPVTLAGALVVACADTLSGLVIAQLKQAGAPFIFGGVISTMDMRTTILPYGAPELHLMSAALTDIAHYYRLPMFSTAGCSDAKVLDQQAGIEAAISCLMAALSGANLIHDVGYLESAQTGSYDMIVMSDEIIGLVKQIIKGIEVTPETLAIDLIDKVGPGGHFLAEEHTVKHLHSEHWYPQYLDRWNFQRWADLGKLTLGDKINQKVKQILKEYRPEPLPPKIQKKIKEMNL